MGEPLAAIEPRCELIPMRPADVDSVLAIEREIYAFPWTRGNFDDSLASGYWAWLLREGLQLLGYAVMMEIVDEVHLLNISVVPARQRGGLGSMLLHCLCDEARRRGAVRMMLEVRKSNLAGSAFYLHHGFAQIGERKDYYPAEYGREDALVLEKTL